MSVKYRKIRPDFIGKIVEKLKLKSRGNKTAIANEYFRLFEQDVKPCKANEDNYRKKVNRFLVTSPLHKVNALKENSREQQARCLIYACLLVYINKSRDNLDRKAVTCLINNIQYEDLKRRGFNLFPSSIRYIMPRSCALAKETFSISFWDLVSADCKMFKYSYFPKGKKLPVTPENFSTGFLNIDFIEEYCKLQYMNMKIVSKIRNLLKHNSALDDYLCKKSGIKHGSCVDVENPGMSPYFYKVEHQGFLKNKEIIDKINFELYTGLIGSAIYHYNAAKGVGYVKNKQRGRKKLDSDWINPNDYHLKYMEKMLHIAMITGNEFHNVLKLIK